jgi:hypothetical protein
LDLVQQLDGVGLLETHAEAALGLEEEASRRILAAYQRVAVQLRTKLGRLPPESFSAQQARSILTQLDGAISVLQERLNVMVLEGTKQMTERGIVDVIREYDAMEAEFVGSPARPLDINVAELATDTSKRLFNNYPASIQAYSDEVRRALALGLQDMTLEGVSPGVMIQRMAGFFEAEEWKLRRIVRTELQGIYAGAKLGGLEQVQRRYAPDLMKTVYQPIDRRTGDDSRHALEVQQLGAGPWLADGDQAAEALVVPVREFFRYVWNGKTRRFMNPPDRPNDRSILVPWREAWAA